MNVDHFNMHHQNDPKFVCILVDIVKQDYKHKFGTLLMNAQIQLVSSELYNLHTKFGNLLHTYLSTIFCLSTDSKHYSRTLGLENLQCERKTIFKQNTNANDYTMFENRCEVKEKYQNNSRFIQCGTTHTSSISD